MDENKDVLNNSDEAPEEDALDVVSEASAEEAEKPAEEAAGEIAEEEAAGESEEDANEALCESEEAPADAEAEDAPELALDGAEENEAEEAAVISEEEAAKAPKKKKHFLPFVIIAAGVIVLAAVLFYGFKMTYNPYNHMGYINVSGKTVGDIAEEYGMTLEEFLAEYSLPADMRADTEETAASFMIPLSKLVEGYGIDFETFTAYYGFDESVTPDTPIGEALDSLTIADRVGEENVEQFIEEYELGDKVTGETKWGEVRRKVDKTDYQRMLEEEAKAATAEDAAGEEETENAEE